MQIEIKELEPCKLSIHYEADAEQILSKRSEVLKAFSKAPVPGFRPGRATVDAIKMHYRQQIEDSLKRSLIEDAYHNTLFEKKLRPHGAPKFNNVSFLEGKFVCEFEMFTKPDFELAPYTNMEIPKPAASMSVEEITQKMLQDLRLRFGEVSPYNENDFTENGDNVILDYEGSIDGEKVDSLTLQGEMLTVGQSKLPEFDSNLLGMKIGDVREFDMVVPKEGLPSLAGKNVHFKVTLSMGSKTVPCALDDALAEKMEKKSFVELREFVQNTALARSQHEFKTNLNDFVSQKLVADNTVAVPSWLTLSEAQYLAHNAKLDWATMRDLDKEKYLEMAEKNVKLSLILDRIREVEPEAQLSDREVLDIIKQNLLHTKMKVSIDEVIKEMNRTGYLQILFSRIRDEHVFDFLIKNSKIIE